MAKKLKKVLSLLLALGMILSMLSVSAFAGEADNVGDAEDSEITAPVDTNGTVDPEEPDKADVTAEPEATAAIETVSEPNAAADPVARIEGTGEVYTTLQAALDAAGAAHRVGETEGSITLLGDTTECVKAHFKDGKTYHLTLDLNGHTITGDGTGPVITYTPGSTKGSNKYSLTINDSVGTGTVTGGNANYGGAVYVSSGGSGVTLTINGGNFTGNTATSCGGAIYFYHTAGGTLVINGGTFSNNTATSNGALPGRGGAIYATGLTVNDGIFTSNMASDDGGAIYASGTTVAITGGEFTGNKALAGGAICSVGAAAEVTLDISKARIYGNSAAEYGDDIKFGLTGGTKKTTLHLMDASEMGMEGVDSWLVDGWYLTEAADRPGEAFDVASWPATAQPGPIYIGLKAGHAHIWAEDYTSDAANHWHKCVNCDAIDEVTAHTMETIPAVAPSCTETGLTEGAKCSVCDRILVAQEAVKATGHTEVIDAAVDPACTETGLTEGRHCSVCNEVLVTQKTVEALGHKWIEGDVITVPGCENAGVQTWNCSRCDSTETRALSATGHTYTAAMEENRVEPTCTVDGSYDLVVRCAVCDAVISSEHVNINALGHEWEEAYTSDATNHWHKCVNCDAINEEAAHTAETIPAVAPTYTDTGLTEGAKCSVCDRVLAVQTAMPVLTQPAIPAMPSGPSTPTTTRPATTTAPTTTTIPNDPVIDISHSDVPLASVPLPFTDIANNSWYQEAVAYVYINDLMNGVGEAIFAPDDLCSRATIVTVLYRLEKTPSIGFSAVFSDVEDGMWYTSAIEWGAANSLLLGYDNTRFGTSDHVTREQLATFLYRYAQLKGYDVSASGSLSVFKDGSQVSDWAKEVMSWAVAMGLFQGDDNGCLNPTASASRAHIAMILMRFDENVARKGAAM